MIKLFIDDVRMPSDVGFNNGDWMIARNWFSSIRCLAQYKPQIVSFDHDLGEDCPKSEGGFFSGFDIAKWLVAIDMHKPEEGFITEDFIFTVHSANPVGAKNIQSYLENYINVKFGKQRKSS